MGFKPLRATASCESCAAGTGWAVACSCLVDNRITQTRSGTPRSKDFDRAYDRPFQLPGFFKVHFETR